MASKTDLDFRDEAHANADALFTGPGEVRSQARELDWSKSPLGPTTGWSAALRTMARSIFDSPFPICLWSGPSYALVYNDAYRRILAAKHPASLGQPGSIVWAEIWEPLQPQFDGVRAGGDPVYFEDAPFVMARLEGGGTETAWFSYSLSALRDEDGSVAAILNISPETTGRVLVERRLAEEQAALARSEAQFRTFAQAMPNHSWTARPDGQLDWFNDQVYAYSNSEPGSLNGDGWANLVHPDDIDAAASAWAGARERGEPYETEFRLRRFDGAYRWHIARAVPIRNVSGEITQWIGTNTDIEDRKVAEAKLATLAETLEQRIEERTAELNKAQDALRQSQKMEAIGNLTGGVAHDFNNLLQVISGNLQLLTKDIAGNDRAERRVSNALAGVSRGAKLASQLLAFGRRAALEPKVVNIGRFVSGIDEMLRRAIGEGVEIETIIAGGLWNTFIDPAQIENALLNLAINARDAMSGTGKLTIEAGNAFLDDAYVGDHGIAAGQYVMLAVTDTGSGMSPEVIAQAFEPFFSTKPEGKGTGLGLSMVYGFVKQSGGHVRIYSEVGIGTTIKIYLPRVDQREDILVTPDTALISGGTETILVAEDDAEVRSTVVETLRELGYRVLTANDAASALTVLESGVAVDLLFTDVVMPGSLKSPELAKKAKERLPHVAVLFTSGYTENAIVHGGRLDLGVELLSKPYSREMLARKVRQVISKQR